jgi:uncharacterized protein YbjT (DUF2867 family)
LYIQITKKQTQMKYVITGGAGNISKPLAEELLQAGQEVTVIGRNAANLKPVIEKGAKAAIGTIEDVAFLKSSFAGADAVYTMIPPKMDAPDWRGYIEQTGRNYAEAIRAAEVKYVVNLSSIGAHMPQGAGPVSGLYRAEQALNTLDGVHILHLRPGYFFTNFLGSIGMVKQAGIIGSNFGSNRHKLVMAHPADIAAVAAAALLKRNFTGHSVRYIASDERTTTEIASVLGAAIGKQELPWITFSDEQTLVGMQQAGLPEEVAKNYVEMGTALHSDVMSEDYRKRHTGTQGQTKLEDFAREFAAAYQAA